MNNSAFHLIELALKGSALLCIGLSMRFWLGQQSAALRSALWLALFSVLLVLPFSLLTKPVWFIKIHLKMTEPSLQQRPHLSPVNPPMPAEAALSSSTKEARWDSDRLLERVYWLGMVGVIGFRLFGSWQVWRLRSRATALPAAYHPLPDAVDSPLRISPDIRVPMTWGTLHPEIAFPEQCKTWSPKERSAAFHHELAHIQHHDNARRWLGTLVCALWWPLPLVWLASRAWKLEQEQACDDAVLRKGHDAGLYATQLLNNARQWQQQPLQTSACLVMATPAGLEERLRSILCPTLNRSPMGGRAARLLFVIGASIAVLGTCCRTEATGPESEKRIWIRTQFIESAPDQAVKAGLPLQGSALLSETELQKAMNTLRQQKGVDIMSAPSVTTKPDQSARVEVVREFMYPTGLDTDGVTPKTFDMIPIGVMIKVKPELQKSGKVRVQAEPLLRDFVGFEVPSLPGRLLQKVSENESKKGELAKPAFHERGWKGQITLGAKSWQVQRLDTLPTSHPLASKAAQDGRETWFVISAEVTSAPQTYTKPATADSESSVVIFGYVHRQGKYPLTPSMTITNLIEKAQGLKGEASYQIELERGPIKSRTKRSLELPKDGNFPLEPGDTVTIKN